MILSESSIAEMLPVIAENLRIVSESKRSPQGMSTMVLRKNDKAVMGIIISRSKDLIQQCVEIELEGRNQ